MDYTSVEYSVSLFSLSCVAWAGKLAARQGR